MCLKNNNCTLKIHFYDKFWCIYLNFYFFKSKKSLKIQVFSDFFLIQSFFILLGISSISVFFGLNCEILGLSRILGFLATLMNRKVEKNNTNLDIF